MMRNLIFAITLLLGCGHSEPFTNPDTATDQPFDPGPPVRITANRGGDSAEREPPDIRARDEEHQPHRTEQQPERFAYAARHAFQKGRDTNANICVVVRIELSDSLCDPFQFRSRSLEGDGRREAGHDGHPSRST